MKSRPPCLAWREKLALRHEDLTPADQLALDAHVQICKACATALADYHYFEARLDALAPPAIKPLPRLSPNFFETHEGPQEAVHLPNVQRHPATVRARSSRSTPRRRGAIIAGRVLGIAALIVLLLASGLLFRVVYQARLAAHPGGNTLLNLDQHTGAVMGVAWSPDGKYLATASGDHTVKVWNAQSGVLVCTYTGNSYEVYALAWSPDGEYIASGGGDNTVQIWRPLSCSAPVRVYTGHTNVVQSIAWSPDSREIISGGWDNTAQIWDVVSGKTLRTLQFSQTVYSVAWSRDGQRIAIGDWDEYVHVLLWNTSTRSWQQLSSYRDGDAVNAVAWSPDGKYLAAGNSDGTVIVRKIGAPGDEALQYSGHTGLVFTVAWSPDGKLIASGSDDNTVRVWNPFSGKTLMVYSAHSKAVSAVAWSPTGTEIASGSFDFTAKVWKVAG